MADLVVITPSRGRPEQFARLVRAVRDTTDQRALVVACLDADDPTLPEYAEATRGVVTVVAQRRSLADWTNYAALEVLSGEIGTEVPRYLASLGDDHLPRTAGWDRLLIDAIEAMDGPGIAYGNDLYQGENLPTAWVVSAELVRAVGWMMLPSCQHLYVDAAIRDLGHLTGRIAYRPDVVIEHLHPHAGKAGWDQSYKDSNSPGRYTQDHAAYVEWRRTQMYADAAKVLALTHPGRM